MQNIRTKAATLLFVVGLAACGGGGAAVSNGELPAVTSTQAAPVANAGLVGPADVASSSVSTAAAGNPLIAIDAGSRASVGSWLADTYYTGGQVTTVSNTIDTSHVTNPAPQAVYQSLRWGANIIYTLANLTPNGAYTVQLHFAESFWHAAGQRLFNVRINGTQVLSNFDIFQAAGGAHIAVAKLFDGTADTNGKFTIQLSATRDNASISGIAVFGQSGSPTPSPSPVGSGADTMPWVYSELWSSSSPFKVTAAQQKSAGATVVPQTYMDALWSQGVARNGTAAGIPIYVAGNGDPLLTTVCTKYGGRCNASNVQIHVPANARTQQISDAHITVIDPAAPGGPIEIDCWQAVIAGSTFQCSWAGVYALGSEGLPNGGEGIHGGMAVTTVFITGQELSNGHIDHALGLSVRCLNNPSLYPANTSNGTDTACDGSSNPPHYGNLMHLLWSPTQIANSPYSAPCKIVLTAFAAYGAYLDDTGNNGLQVNTQNDLSYTVNPATQSFDPWPSVQSALNAAGDGYSRSWSSCLNRLQASDFELLQIAKH